MFVANETEAFHQNMHVQTTQLIMAEKELAERQELLSELQEKQVRKIVIDFSVSFFMDFNFF